MTDKIYCDHLFTRGAKKGKICGTLCLVEGATKCSRHRRTKCPHGRQKYLCIECGGVGVCDHGKQKHQCVECGGSCVCPHKKRKYDCVECQGNGVCIHNKDKRLCIECGGTGICQHGRNSYFCAKCGGLGICSHGKYKRSCVDCGGKCICPHKKRKDRCIDCHGTSMCDHSKRKDICPECSPSGHLKGIVSSAVRRALKNNKKNKTLDYIGCDVEHLRSHIESQFQEGMTWDNYGEWEIDHITPVKFENPSLEQVIERLHYTNLQPLWASENRAKKNLYVG